MGYNRIFTYTNAEAFIAELLAFANSNGWTTVETVSTRIQIEKDGVTWKVEKASAARINMWATVNGQTSPDTIYYGDLLENVSTVEFISSGNNLFILAEKWYSGALQGLILGGVFRCYDKIGNWSGGVYVFGSWSYSYYCYDTYFNATMPAMGSFFYENAWTSVGGAAGGRVFGARGFEVDTIKEPNYFNSAFLPIPALLCMWDANTAYYIPLGYVDGVYFFKPGDIYVDGDILTISGHDYLHKYDSRLAISFLFRVS